MEGTYLAEASSSCTLCDGGTFCEEGSGTMTPCPTGHFAPSGSSSCSKCAASQYNDAEGSSTCKECPLNQRGVQDRTACECNQGFVPSYSSDGILNCLCPAGYTYERGLCVLCGAGMYKNWDGNDACLSCDKTALKGSFSTWTSVLSAVKTNNGEGVSPPISPLNCTCEKGDFQLDEPPPGDPGFDGHGHCSECPEGANCVERGIKLATLRLRPSYWRSGSSSYNIELCKVDEVCSQENVTDISSQCIEGHKGPLCNVCNFGYSKNLVGICESCKLEIRPEAILLVLLLAFALIVIKTKMKKEHVDKFNVRRRNAISPRMSARTKFKILATFYQTITQFETVLNIRFPKVFEVFTRFLSSIVNVDSLKLGRVGCVIPTTFHTKLLVSTILPLLASAFIFTCMFVARRLNKDDHIKKTIKNNCIELFLGLTFLLFASVSTTIFDTFNCAQYGDDPKLYLVADMSIDCADPTHKLFEKYAMGMMIIYPFGIPYLYAKLLFKRQKEIQADNRASNKSLIKSSFLWEMYEPRVWWFEIFECGRRLAMGGLLVFVRPGSTSQIVLTMVLAMGSVVIFTHVRPYVAERDDDLAVACQISVFITIFGALLVRVEVDTIDSYDQTIFGYVLVAVNMVGVAMVLKNASYTPLRLVTNYFSDKNQYGGAIKGLTDEHDRNSSFIKYFEKLAMSMQHESGYVDVPLENAKWSTWSEQTRAKM